MKTQFDIENALRSGKLQNELEYERALVADRKLRILCKENRKLIPIRKELRDIIERYENRYWSEESEISATRIKESDLAELIAEKERIFIQRRKGLIKSRLKQYGLNQQHLMILLGHRSKTHMSELMNGLSPFTLNDLIIINRLFKIDLSDLIPTTIPQKSLTTFRRLALENKENN